MNGNRTAYVLIMTLLLESSLVRLYEKYKPKPRNLPKSMSNTLFFLLVLIVNKCMINNFRDYNYKEKEQSI